MLQFVCVFLNKQSSDERSDTKTCDRNEGWGSVSWPVVKEDVWGPNLVWGEPQVLDTRVAFWIPAQVDVRPVLWQREASFYTTVCQTFYETVAPSIKRHAKGKMFPVRNKLQSYCSSRLPKRKYATRTIHCSRGGSRSHSSVIRQHLTQVSNKVSVTLGR